MERHGSRSRRETATLFALLFVLIYAVVGLWTEIENTPPPTSTAVPSASLGTSASPNTTIIPPTVTPVPFATPPGELPRLFSQAWWSNFLGAFAEPRIWTEVIAGVLVAVILATLASLQKLLSMSMQRCLKYILENIPDRVDRVRSHFDRVHSAVKDSLELVRSQVIEVSRIGRYTLQVLTATGQVSAQVWLLIVAPIKAFWAKYKAPKWYKNKGVIDPGLIEVSLAVTAIMVALPALVLGGNVSEQRLAGLGFLRIASLGIPTGVSINFINLYTKDKGSRSLHVLFGPIEDWPFFLLSWTILVVFAIFALYVWSGSLGQVL